MGGLYVLQKMRAKQDIMEAARKNGDKTKKPYLISGSDILQLVPEMGSCFATDRILVDGEEVGYMYREEPDFPEDSGWRFLAGDESEEYMDDEWNTGLFSVNTVANYDRSIIPYLESKVGSAFGKDLGADEFQPEPLHT